VTLRKRAEFLAVRGGSRASTASFLLEARVRPATESVTGPRFGFTVTKKLGGAVERNRMRRRLKAAVLEVLRLGLPLPDRDYVVVARHAALTRDFRDIGTDLRVALQTVHKGPPGGAGSRRPPGPREERPARPDRSPPSDEKGG
jgi:ribonuclease P protein component